MKLLNCQIVNFGCLSDCSFNFDDGLNIVFAENGKGKSTFAAFLKAMLYGLPSNRKAGLDNERRRYAPWQGGTFGGALCFEAEGVGYRLERFFGAKEKDDRFALYHLATGNPSLRYTEAVGEELFGVDADGFERSLYISQALPFLPPDNNSIRARLGSLLDASDDLGKFEKADELLDTSRRHYRAQGERGLIPELSLAIRDKEEEIQKAKAAEAGAASLLQERDAIESKKNEVGQALAEAKAKRAEAEKRRLWEEQNASYTSLLELRETTKQQLAPLEAFFTPHLPTEEEIQAADAAVTECTTLTAQIAQAKLSEEDVSVLSAFRETYGDSAPDDAFMDRMREALSHWKREKERIRVAEARLQEEKNSLRLKFDERTPTEGERAAIRTAKEVLEDAGALLYRDNDRTKRPHLLIPLLLLCGVFAVITVLGFVLSLLALAIPSLVLLLASFGFSTFLVLQKAKTPNELAKRLEDYRVKQRRLAFLLAPFDYAEKDPLLAASRFFDELARYELLLEEEAELRRALEEYRQKEKEARETLIAALGSGECHNPEAKAARIEAEVPVYRLLLQKKAELATKCELLTRERELASRRVSDFLSNYPSLADLSPRAALDTVKQNMLLSKQALTAYTSARNRLANYLQTTRFDPDAPPPPYGGDIRILTESENTLQKAFTDLEALSSVKESERKRLCEIALTIPGLEAEREKLLAEKEEAEHTLSLILSAKELLKEAKEDLSTRYLRDMELHFDRYYQKIKNDVHTEIPADGARISSFTMDTSLALSCEAYGERRPIAVLSRGERDLVSFCARLALLESIFTKESPVLVLDDPFINLDDGNYSKAANLLAHLAERYQIVYTVCSTARLPANLPLKSL
ncbi:MAG: hypothetical protein E7609_02980 [Ruminococcaceae bacterium]|nr:hypothetical protein [Oscillospiraceae bacterium]